MGFEHAEARYIVTVLQTRVQINLPELIHRKSVDNFTTGTLAYYVRSGL